MYNVIYVVHSDEDENNIYQEFNTKAEALEYAKANIAEKPWVEAIEVYTNDFGEVEDEGEHETVWSYAEEQDEDIAECFTKEDLDIVNDKKEDEIRSEMPVPEEVKEETASEEPIEVNKPEVKVKVTEYTLPIDEFYVDFPECTGECDYEVANLEDCAVCADPAKCVTCAEIKPEEVEDPFNVDWAIKDISKAEEIAQPEIEQISEPTEEVIIRAEVPVGTELPEDGEVKVEIPAEGEVPAKTVCPVCGKEECICGPECKCEDGKCECEEKPLEEAKRLPDGSVQLEIDDYDDKGELKPEVKAELEANEIEEISDPVVNDPKYNIPDEEEDSGLKAEALETPEITFEDVWNYVKEYGYEDEVETEADYMSCGLEAKEDYDGKYIEANYQIYHASEDNNGEYPEAHTDEDTDYLADLEDLQDVDYLDAEHLFKLVKEEKAAGTFKESLKESFNEAEWKEFTELCNKLFLTKISDVAKFAKAHGGVTDQALLAELRKAYKAAIGDEDLEEEMSDEDLAGKLYEATSEKAKAQAEVFKAHPMFAELNAEAIRDIVNTYKKIKKENEEEVGNPITPEEVAEYITTEEDGLAPFVVANIAPYYSDDKCTAPFAKICEADPKMAEAIYKVAGKSGIEHAFREDEPEVSEPEEDVWDLSWEDAPKKKVEEPIEKKFSLRTCFAFLFSDDWAPRDFRANAAKKVLANYFGYEVKEAFESHPAIESEQELQGIDNAVVPCEKYTLVAHSEDEKPLDCKMEKKPLEKPLTEEAEEEVSEPEIEEVSDVEAEIPEISESEAEIKEVSEDTGLSKEVEEKIADLILDEKEAIDGYKDAIEELSEKEEISDEAKETLEHISDEELEHIEELADVLKDDAKENSEVSQVSESLGAEDEFIDESLEVTVDQDLADNRQPVEPEIEKISEKPVDEVEMRKHEAGIEEDFNSDDAEAKIAALIDSIEF